MLDKEILEEFDVFYSKSRSDDDKILLILTYQGARMGAIGASRIPADAHPCIGDNVYFGVDIWEMIHPTSGELRCYDHSRFDPGLEIHTVVLQGLGDMFYRVFRREALNRGGAMVYNVFTHEPPPEGVTTMHRQLWNQLVEAGKAAVVDPDIPLIVLPPPEGNG